MIARTLVVIPTYNERVTLPEVVARTLAAPVEVDLLIVDDASPDGTGELADDLVARHPEISVLHGPHKRGLGPAYRSGLGWGLEQGYEVLVEMDADLSHDPGQLPAILAQLATSDVVIGSRYRPGGRIENWPWHRRALSAAGNRYVQIVTGLPIRDATSGYRAYRRAVLEEIDLAGVSSDGYSFQIETLLRAWRAGFRIAEEPITFVERRHGASKISRAIVFEAVWRVLIWGLRGRRANGRVHPRSIAASR